MFKSVFLFLATYGVGAQLFAAEPAPFVFRKIAVFPIKTDEIYSAANLDEAWMGVRAELTKGEQFFVATKAFMKQSDAFQPRGELSTIDAVGISQLLDSDAIIALWIERRELHFDVYESQNGSKLWQYTYSFNPSLPVEDQIVRVCISLAKDLIATIPFQGTVRESKIDKRIIFKEDGISLAQITVPQKGAVSIGDPVQFVRLKRISLEPLFQTGGAVTVFGEGFVNRMDGDEILVQVTKLAPGETLHISDLVRLPKEVERREKELLLVNRSTKVSVDSVAQKLELIDRKEEERATGKGLVTASAFISSIVGFLLLAL